MIEKIKIWLKELRNMVLIFSLIFLSLPLLLLNKDQTTFTATIIIYVIGIIVSLLIWKKSK